MGRAGGRAPVAYVNVPETIAIVVSNRLATLHELNTVYGVQDLHDLLEIIVVDAVNKAPE